MEKAISDMSRTASHFGFIDGAIQENDRFHKRSSAMESRTGTYVFSTHEFARDQTAVGIEKEKEVVAYHNLATQGQSIVNRIAAKEKKFDSERRKLFGELRAFVEQYVRASVKIGMYAGAIKEDDRFMQVLDEYKKKTFEEGVTM